MPRSVAVLAGSSFLLAGCGVLLVGCADIPVEPTPGRVVARDTLERRLGLQGRTLVLDGHDGHVDIAVDSVEQVELVLVRSARGATRRSAHTRLETVMLYEVEGDEVAQFVWTSELAGTSLSVTARVPPGAHVVVELDAGTIRAAGLDPARTVLRADSVFYDDVFDSDAAPGR